MPVGQGLCLSGSSADASATLGRPPTWVNLDDTVLVNDVACQDVCNQHVACAGASFAAATEKCYLVMNPKPTYGNWTNGPINLAAVPQIPNANPVMGADGQPGYACAKKDQPIVVTEAGDFAHVMAWLSGLAFLIACVAMCCTCSLLYTTSTRRKGKKGACPLLHKLLCPCCIGTEKRKFADSQFDALENEEEGYD